MTIPTNAELQTKSLKELVELYNANNPPKPVKVFKDKPTAIARCAKLRDGATKAETAASAPAPAAPKAKAKKAEATEATPKAGRARVPFDLPAAKEITDARSGSKRAQLVELCGSQAGITVEEAMTKFDWNRREALEAFRLIHKLLGYGLRESAEGRIHLVRN